MTRFNFNSQICTTREQSERLIALGLKKETADMRRPHYNKYSTWVIDKEECLNEFWLPAWSLHRLIEMMPKKVDVPTKGSYYRVQYSNSIAYELGDYSIAKFVGENIYDTIIDCIEWLIKEGYFNKEYLV